MTTTDEKGLTIDLTQPGAVLSDDRVYRYLLWRPCDRIVRGGNSFGKTTDGFRELLAHLAPAAPPKIALWIMLNPSTADETQPDATIRRVKGFSESWGCTAFIVANLFALRSTDPVALRGPGVDKVGPKNDEILSMVLTMANIGPIVVGWGSWGHAFPVRVAQIGQLIGQRPAECLGYTKQRQPMHPLYLAERTPLQPWFNPQVDRSRSR